MREASVLKYGPLSLPSPRIHPLQDSTTTTVWGHRTLTLRYSLAAAVEAEAVSVGASSCTQNHGIRFMSSSLAVRRKVLGEHCLDWDHNTKRVVLNYFLSSQEHVVPL